MRTAAQLIQHDHVVRYVVQDRGIQPYRLRRAGDESRRRHGIAAGEERHMVALAHQFFAQMRDNPFGAPVKSRRDALHQRSDLGNFHVTLREMTLATTCERTVCSAGVRDAARRLSFQTAYDGACGARPDSTWLMPPKC